MKYKVAFAAFLILIISTNSASAFLPLGQDNLIIQNIYQTTSSKQGTYNQTLANNALKDSGSYKLNFINGTNNPVSLVDDTNRKQINITISGSNANGVTSLNALTGALTIACVSANTTCTSSGGNTITINTAWNVVTTGLSAQTISKALTINNLILGGDENVGSNGFTNSGHKSTLPSNTGTLLQQNGTGAYLSNNVRAIASGNGISVNGTTGTVSVSNSGVTSITGTSNNVTASSSTGTVTLNLGQNVVTTGLSAQTITKSLTINSGILGGDLNVGSNGFTNSGHKATLPSNSGTICLTNQTSSCGTGSSGTVIGSTNAGKATGSVGVLSSPTSTLIKGRNMTGTSPITVTKTNDTDIAIACSTCLTSALVTSQNIGKGTGSVGFLSSPTSTVIKSKNATAGTGITVSGNTTDVTITNSGVTGITGTSGNLTTTSSTGSVTLNTGNNIDYLAKAQTFTANKDFGGTGSLHDFFGNTGLTVRNPTASFGITIAGSPVTANRTINLPLITATDTFVTINLPNNFTGNNQFPSGKLLLENPAKTFAYGLTASAITANRTLTFPLITGSDTLGALGMTQTWTGTNTHTGLIDLQATGTLKASSSGIIIRNPAASFATTITNAAITANRTLNMPLTTQTETIAVVPGTNFTSPSAPATTTSTTGVMSNLFATFTPHTTGNLLINICGQMSSGTAGDGAKFDVRIGTSLITEGSAVGNTLVGTAKGITSSTATGVETACNQVYKTGLTVGTKEFIQIGKYAVTGGTASFSNFDVFVSEVE